MIKKSIVFILACTLICLIGCRDKDNDDRPNGSESGSTGLNVGREAEEASQLPEIVFMNTIRYVEAYSSEGPKSAMTFYDKNGNHYVSTDEYVCSLLFEQLVREYAEGKLSDKISFHTSCDVEELLENYNKLCQLVGDGFEIVHPEMGPDVLANHEIWYGLYYDQEGNIQFVEIHERNEHGDHYADDERVNEIYEWYLSTFKK